MCPPSRLTLLLSVATVAVIAFFAVVDPSHCVWAPKCTFKLLTGWQCPGCGAGRAIHALLHGHPLQAIRYNYFLIPAIPYLAAVVAVGWVPSLRRHQAAVQGQRPAMTYVALLCIWWVLRNLLGV
jgi:hypothetical protein